MAKVLIIGAGGVSGVVVHKCAQLPEVFSEIVLASRTEAKCKAIAAQINQRIDENVPVTSSWISDEEMAANMDMIRTMSVKPPSGQGRVRLINVEGVDLQPCGGTHVKATGEIGPIRVGKIENKGKHNRRVNLHFVE